MKKIFIKLSVMMLIAAVMAVSCRKNDKTAPVISLKGDASMVVTLNSDFSDPGATAQDNEDGTLNVNVSGTVDPDLAGTYVIKYSATDGAGNSATAERVVLVRNSAYNLAGSYLATAMLMGDTIGYPATITGSTTLNNRLWLLGFGDYAQAVVFADLVQDSLIVPLQDASFGTPVVTRSFNARGMRHIVNDTLVIELDFYETTPGSQHSGILYYKRAL